MRGKARIEKWVDAVIERRAIERACTEEPSPAKNEALTLARARVIEAERQLNGSQLGQARRLLAERVQA